MDGERYGKEHLESVGARHVRHPPALRRRQDRRTRADGGQPLEHLDERQRDRRRSERGRRRVPARPHRISRDRLVDRPLRAREVVLGLDGDDGAAGVGEQPLGVRHDRRFRTGRRPLGSRTRTNSSTARANGTWTPQPEPSTTSRSAGQDMNQADVELPQLEYLLAVSGTLDAPAHDITFQGLRFSYTSWLNPSTSDGWADQQTGGYIHGDGKGEGYRERLPEFRLYAALLVADARRRAGVRREERRVLARSLRGPGIRRARHWQRRQRAQDRRLVWQRDTINVTGCVFTQIAAGGIVGGGIRANAHHPSDPRMIDQNVTIVEQPHSRHRRRLPRRGRDPGDVCSQLPGVAQRGLQPAVFGHQQRLRMGPKRRRRQQRLPSARPLPVPAALHDADDIEEQSVRRQLHPRQPAADERRRRVLRAEREPGDRVLEELPQSARPQRGLEFRHVQRRRDKVSDVQPERVRRLGGMGKPQLHRRQRNREHHVHGQLGRDGRNLRPEPGAARARVPAWRPTSTAGRRMQATRPTSACRRSCRPGPREIAATSSPTARSRRARRPHRRS